MTTVEILKQLPPQMVRMYLVIRQQILLRKKGEEQMNTRYYINKFDEVVPIVDGRVSNNTREYREATELELQQREEIATLEKRIEELEALV